MSAKQPLQAFPDFETALAQCGRSGYEDELLVDVVVQKTIAYRSKLNGSMELDAHGFRMLGALSLALVSKAASTLNVLDFGGAAGLHYIQAKKLLPNTTQLNWHVVETPTMVAKAQAIHESSEIRFFPSVKKAAATGLVYDLVYANSSLQFTADPFLCLAELVALNAKAVFITRTPFSDLEKKVVVIQTSRLQDNGPGPLPPAFVDQVMRYPISFIPLRQVQDLLAPLYELKIHEPELPTQLKVGDTGLNAFYSLLYQLRF